MRANNAPGCTRSIRATLNSPPIPPRFAPPKPAKNPRKPAKNPHFALGTLTSISSPTPHPINPYIHSRPQSRVHATFFPGHPLSADFHLRLLIQRFALSPNPYNNPPPMSTPIVTRFAPSPTGYLHVGGARTPLFSWPLARHQHRQG